jgi:hypothetical protein
VALGPAIRTRRDDNLRAGSPNRFHEGVEVVALVRDTGSISTRATLSSLDSIAHAISSLAVA